MNRMKQHTDKKDLGYPWGVVEVPQGYDVLEVPAACDSDDHYSHPYCDPGWEEDLPPDAVILADPCLLDEGWVALVAIPKNEDN